LRVSGTAQGETTVSELGKPLDLRLPAVSKHIKVRDRDAHVGGVSFPEIELVEIHCDRANHSSQVVPRRLGFTVVGHRTKPVQAPNETGIDDVWRMTRFDWMPDA
jgi:hypothetical protein